MDENEESIPIYKSILFCVRERGKMERRRGMIFFPCEEKSLEKLDVKLVL